MRNSKNIIPYYFKMSEGRRSDRVKNTLCYVPFFAFIIYFIEKEKTERINKNIVYAILLLIFFFIIPILPYINFFISLLFYLITSLFLGYKSYIEEDVDFEFIDKFFLKK